MRSGLYSYTSDPAFAAALERRPESVWTPQQLLDTAFTHPANFPPGSQYEYNNTNYVLLGLVIEKLTGMSASAAFQSRIFDPLGLRNTALPAAADSTLTGPHPRGYMWGPNEAFEGPLPDAQLKSALAGEVLPTDHTDDNPSWAWTAGAVTSRAEDVADFTEAMVSGSLLDDTTRQWRQANLKPMNASAAGAAASLGFGTYGFGLERAGPMYGHSGNMVGFSGLAVHDPTARNTVVVLATVYLTPQGDAPQNASSRSSLSSIPSSTSSCAAKGLQIRRFMRDPRTRRRPPAGRESPVVDARPTSGSRVSDQNPKYTAAMSSSP